MNLKSATMRACRHLRQRWRADGKKGSAAIEFAMIAPVLFVFLFGIIETGVLFFASAMLQNATDDTARRIRTGQLSGTLTATQLRNAVCSEVDGLIHDCAASLQIDLRSFSSFGGSSYPTVIKGNGTVDPSKLAVQTAADCSVVLLRTFYAWKIMTPLMTPLIENTTTGQYVLSAAAAFRTEPYTSSSTC